jgi:rod shape-determining protein MreB
MAGYFSDDLAIDLGTATTRIHSRRRGLVVCEPTVVARDRSSGALCAVGEQALQMLGRTTQDIEVVRPIRDGVIAEFESAQALLGDLVRRARGRLQLRKPRVAIAVSSELTPVELRALREAVLGAGASRVFPVLAPLAAALGAGPRVRQPGGHLVVDIGAGTTEVALLSMSGAVHARTMRIGGDALDEVLAEHFKRRHDLRVGMRTIERIKCALGARDCDADPALDLAARAAAEGEKRRVVVSGHDRVGGAPRKLEVDESEILATLESPIRAIIDAVARVLVEAPAELCAEIAARPLVLTGGGALLPDMPARLQARFHMPVLVGDDPAGAVARGCGASLDQLERAPRHAAPDSRRPIALQV